MVQNRILVNENVSNDLVAFTPMIGLSNRHAMTIISSRWPRRFEEVLSSKEDVLVKVAESASVLVEVNHPFDRSSERQLRPQSNPTLIIILHGLEGSSRSHYVLGLSRKLLSLGFSTARMNMRNCGNTLHLCETLYNAGLSADVDVVSKHFFERGFHQILLVGFSLGGNVVLKTAAELSRQGASLLKGVCAVSPSIDLNASVSALENGINRIYEINFLKSLKEKIKAKDKLKPGVYDLSRLKLIDSIRSFDDTYTAPDGGYRSADDYYTRASALHMVADISVPTMIIASKDDPIVPFSSFQSPGLKNKFIELVAPSFGGHAGFVARNALRLADFCNATKIVVDPALANTPFGSPRDFRVSMHRGSMSSKTVGACDVAGGAGSNKELDASNVTSDCFWAEHVAAGFCHWVARNANL